MNDAPERTLTVRDARAYARRVIEHHFGTRPRRIEHRPSGLSNFVFSVAHESGDFVVRISPVAGKINTFIKEQWAVTRVRDAGVPTPEILEVGNEVVPCPYMVSRKAEGTEATHHPDRVAILRELARFAERINSIPTSGFGNVFDWSGNRLSRNETWKEYLAAELDLDGRLETLARHRLLPEERLASIRAILEGAGEGQAPALNHGDLRVKNVIVSPDGRIAAILDWEDCVSSLAPQWELSVALHDLSIDEKQEFLEGYGLDAGRFAAMAPLVKAINLLNYAPHVHEPDDAGARHGLERLRQRLGGALDLYSP